MRSRTLPPASRVAVDVERDGVTVPLSAERVREIVRVVCRRQKVTDALISVTFVTNRAMAKMNREYLEHTGATDVMTFELAAERGVVMGDVYIAPDVARENARANAVGVREELTRLVVHGTLHVLGFVHPEGEERMSSDMWRLQERIVDSLR